MDGAQNIAVLRKKFDSAKDLRSGRRFFSQQNSK